MIRTNVVKLTVIPAVAYRRKLPSGGSSIVIVRADYSQPGIASISNKTGEAILAANTPEKQYPREAFREAMQLTNGMPYRKQGSIKLTEEMLVAEVKDEAEEQQPQEVVLDSASYQKIIDTYTDKAGKLSYDLLNKDLIKFAHYSSIVREMVNDKVSVDKIRLYVVKNKFANITGNYDLSDEEVLKIVEMLDDVSPKGVFKNLNEEIRKLLGGKRK